MKVFLKITQARYWEALTSRSASSIPPLLLQLQCNKQPFQISNKQYSHYFPINSLSSLPPINTDSTVQTHLQLSCCCSAPFPRQDEEDKRYDNSFHFLNVVEGIRKAAISNHPRGKETQVTPSQKKKKKSTQHTPKTSNSQFWGRGGEPDLFMSVLINFQMETHGACKAGEMILTALLTANPKHLSQGVNTKANGTPRMRTLALFSQDTGWFPGQFLAQEEIV